MPFAFMARRAGRLPPEAGKRGGGFGVSSGTRVHTRHARAPSPALTAMSLRSSLRRRAAAVALLAAPLLLAACDTDDDGEVDAGEFEAIVAGDVARALAGDAYYTTVERDGRTVFALFFFHERLRDVDRDDYTYVALSRVGAEPGVGVFAIANDDASASAFHGQYADVRDADDPEAARGPAASAAGGVLTLTGFRAGNLTGFFRFDAVGLDLPDTATFIEGTVAGTFEARPLSAAVLDDLGVAFDLD